VPFLKKSFLLFYFLSQLFPVILPENQEKRKNSNCVRPLQNQNRSDYFHFILLAAQMKLSDMMSDRGPEVKLFTS